MFSIPLAMFSTCQKRSAAAKLVAQTTHTCAVEKVQRFHWHRWEYWSMLNNPLCPIIFLSKRSRLESPSWRVYMKHFQCPIICVHIVSDCVLVFHVDTHSKLCYFIHSVLFWLGKFMLWMCSSLSTHSVLLYPVLTFQYLKLLWGLACVLVCLIVLVTRQTRRLFASAALALCDCPPSEQPVQVASKRWHIQQEPQHHCTTFPLPPSSSSATSNITFRLDLTGAAERWGSFHCGGFFFSSNPFNPSLASIPEEWKMLH